MSKSLARRLLAGCLSAGVVGLMCLGGSTQAFGMPIGFASLNGGTTGGAGGATVIATTSTQFRNYATQAGPLNIQVVGNLNVGGVRVASDKSILGVGSTSGLIGSLQLSDVSNVIIRNLSLSNPSGAGEGDSITLRETTNVWIDHNNIFDSTDGLLDIVRESDFVTVSWNKFYYTSEYATNVNTGHRFAMLIGNSDGATEDADNLRVTLHHNFWGENVRERMPRVRYGDVHVFNDYFNTPGDNYAVRAAIGAEVLIENNYFENVADPYEKFPPDSGPQPLVEASGNVFVNSGGKMEAGDDVFTPPYAYTLDNAVDVKNLVLAGAGVGFLAGDYNGDGTVDGKDFLEWQMGNSPDPLSSSDLEDWRMNYGAASSLTATMAVPEPSTLFLGLITILGGATRRR